MLITNYEIVFKTTSLKNYNVIYCRFLFILFSNASFCSFQNRQKFTIYQYIYVINELVSCKKFTIAKSLLSIGLLSSGSTVHQKIEQTHTHKLTYENSNID